MYKTLKIKMPEKKLVAFHPSVTIAHCIEGNQRGKLLLAVYDAGYRMKAYIGSANPIGGNPSNVKGDKSTQDTIHREVSEEYNPDFQGPEHNALVFGQKVDWASPRDIELVRNSLLARIQPWKDFYVRFSQQIKKDDKLGDCAGDWLYSVFYSQISSDAVECAQENISRNKTLSNEGFVGIFTLDDLVKSELGEFAVAHAAAPMINLFYFDCNIPYPQDVHVEPLSEPIRKSFRDYLEDFKYSTEEPKPGKPSFSEIVFGRESN